MKTFTDGGQTVTYGYDRTGNCSPPATRTTRPSPEESFRYDANGNRDSADYVIGRGNRLLSDGRFNYAYDLEGNLIRKTEIATGNVTEYTYDFRNRLVRVEERSAGGVSSNASQYAYDVLGRRITVVENGVVTHTVYNGNNAWADFGVTGAVTARYLFGDRLDQNLARWRPGQGLAWYVTDKWGVPALASAAGVLLDRATYAAFGQVLSNTNPAAADRFAFTGRE